MAKQPFNKPPISFAQQVQRLQQRGLLVPDTERAKFYLSQLNYYRFAAYCLPFEQNHETHAFVVGTRFDDVLNLYIFDRELRLLVLDAIERFEVSLRTQLAYHLSKRYNSPHPHLMPELFASVLTYGSSLNRLASDVRSSKEDFIRHLTNKYEEELPPIWASVELMTMGQLSKWYNNVKKRQDRQAIATVYQVDEKILTSFCKNLTHVRNYCAHHARLWNRGFTVTMTIPVRGPEDLIDSLDRTNLQGRQQRKLYNTLVMLQHLMNVMNPGHHWKQRLLHLIDSHQIDTVKMGFPNDWRTRPFWS